MKNRVPNVKFATNPCRIKFFEQEIVIFREDLMSRMLRNLVGVKPDVKNDDLKRYVSQAHLFSLCAILITRKQLVQTILDQSHLMPVTTSIQPTLPDYDHALRLYPLPTAVNHLHAFSICAAIDSVFP